MAQLGGVIFLGQPSGTFMHIVSKLLIFSINLQTGYIAGLFVLQSNDINRNSFTS